MYLSPCFPMCIEKYLPRAGGLCARSLRCCISNSGSPMVTSGRRVKDTDPCPAAGSLSCTVSVNRGRGEVNYHTHTHTHSLPDTAIRGARQSECNHPPFHFKFNSRRTRLEDPISGDIEPEPSGMGHRGGLIIPAALPRQANQIPSRRSRWSISSSLEVRLSARLKNSWLDICCGSSLPPGMLTVSFAVVSMNLKPKMYWLQCDPIHHRCRRIAPCAVYITCKYLITFNNNDSINKQL